MSELARLTLIPLTAIPAIYMFYFIFGMSAMPFDSVLLIHGAIMLLTVVLAVIYVSDAFRNSRVPTEKKALWAVVLILGGYIAQMVYFWHYLRWREPSNPQ